MTVRNKYFIGEQNHYSSNKGHEREFLRRTEFSPLLTSVKELLIVLCSVTVMSFAVHNDWDRMNLFFQFIFHPSSPDERFFSFIYLSLVNELKGIFYFKIHFQICS